MELLPSTSTKSEKTLCQLCEKLPRLYTCPRCGIGYCNSQCYKSEAHLDCSENFYKQWVEEELTYQERDPESRRKMIDILKRLHQQEEENTDFLLDNENNYETFDESPIDSDDEIDVGDLEERIQHVNLDNADEVWSVLTDAEKAEFEASIKNGEAEKFLPQWTPWWTHCIKKILIYEIEEENDQMKDLPNCPCIIDVPVINNISKASPTVKYNLINVLYSYVYTVLYYNGDYMSCASEAVNVFLAVCATIKSNKVFDNLSDAKNSVSECIETNDWLSQDKSIMSVIEIGVNSIIKGPYEKNSTIYIAAAISDLHRLISAAMNEFPKKKVEAKEENFSAKFQDKKSDINLSKKQLQLYLKKLEYYLSWTKYNENVFSK